MNANVEWLDTVGAAQFVDLPKKTLEDYRHRKVGPAWYRIGRRARYKKADLLDWIESRRQAA